MEDLAYRAKSQLSVLSTDITNFKLYGYPYKHSDVDERRLLSRLLKEVELEQVRMSHGGGCLSNQSLQSLKEKISRLAPASCLRGTRSDCFKDSSKKTYWDSQHPHCVSRERWEEIAYEICGGLRLEAVLNKNVDFICDISFEITRKLLPCDVLIGLHIRKQACDLGLVVKRSKGESEIDFKLLIEETGAELTMEEYNKLLALNFNYDIVKTVYFNGCTIKPIPLLINTSTSSYSVEDIGITDFPDIERIKSLGLSSEYARNPIEFKKRHGNDYTNL